MCILPKWCRKRYGTYLMGKLFASDPDLENERVYVVTRLMHDYKPSQYVEPDSKYTEEESCAQISEDLKDEHSNFSRGPPSNPKFSE